MNENNILFQESEQLSLILELSILNQSSSAIPMKKTCSFISKLSYHEYLKAWYEKINKTPG